MSEDVSVGLCYWQVLLNIPQCKGQLLREELCPTESAVGTGPVESSSCRAVDMLLLPESERPVLLATPPLALEDPMASTWVVRLLYGGACSWEGGV